LYFSWNADEVNVVLSDMELYLFSSRSQVRRNLATSTHVTTLITANAAGQLAPPYIIFPGVSLSDIPNAALECGDVWAAFNETAWMTEELFQVFMMKFVQFIQKDAFGSVTCHHDTFCF
jgi:hypothetical protein